MLQWLWSEACLLYITQKPSPILYMSWTLCVETGPLFWISCMFCEETQSCVLNLLYAACRNPVLYVAFPVCFVQTPSPTCWIFCMQCAETQSYLLHFLYALCRNPVLCVEFPVCFVQKPSATCWIFCMLVQKPSPICCISCMLCAETQSYLLHFLYALCRNPVLSVEFPVCFVQKPSPTCWISMAE